LVAAPRIGDMCCQEFEDGDDGKPKPTGRYLFTNVKHNIFGAMPTLAYKLVEASGGIDPVIDKEITITRVEWCGEVGITADQAVAVASAANKGKASTGVVTFLLDMLAAGPVLRNTIVERGESRGFTKDQLRRARGNADILAIKEPGRVDGLWWWMKPEHEPAWRESFKQEGVK
jgi:hypothetical protein